MKLQFGFIGKDEIELAKQELIQSYRFDDGSWMEKSLWYEKPHTGNYVKGYEYDDIEEVLIHETEHSIDAFKNMNDIELYVDEFDYSFSGDDITKFKKIFDEGKTAYMIDEEIGDDKEYLAWNKIKDGQYCWNGTVKDAYKELNEWKWDSINNNIELLVIGILR